MASYRDPYVCRNSSRTIAIELKRKLKACAFAQGMALMSPGLSSDERQRINAQIAMQFNNWAESNIVPLCDEIINKEPNHA